MKVQKGQLRKLIDKIEGTDLLEFDLEIQAVDNRDVMIATVMISDQYDTYQEKFLVGADGVVKL